MTASWGMISAGELAEAAGGDLLRGDPSALITGISTDSRNVSDGCIFWALKGERFDGHDFVEKAFESGAKGAVVEKGRKVAGGGLLVVVEETLKALGDLARWWRSSLSARVAAITGSAGKTSTKEMLFEVLSLCGKCLKTEGNLNNLIGLPLTVLRLKAEHEFAVLEMGMNVPGEIRRLTEICRPDLGIITNVGMAHLEGVGDIEGVARAKTELLAAMSPSSTVVLNGDDKLLMKTALPYGRKTVTCGLGSLNDVRAEGIVEDKGKTRFRLVVEGQETDVILAVPGIHNVRNALCAAAGACAMGADLAVVKQGLERFMPVKGRLMSVVLRGGALMIDDTYNANPLSLMAALETARAIAADRNSSLIIGLGDMRELGRESEKAHLEAGRKVASIGPKLFLVTGEFSEVMMRGALEAGMRKQAVRRFRTPEDMGSYIADMLSEGDIVLLKASRKIGLDRAAALLSGKAREGKTLRAL